MSLHDRSPPEDDLEEEVEMEPWVAIQRATFTNWVCDKLRGDGVGIANVRKDFRDGQKLCSLMKVLTRKPLPGKVISKKSSAILNHYEASGNLALALKTMEQDGVRLVNIGAEDIRAGNLKLILGMIWTLIRKYQIGSTGKSLPKKLMLAWVNAVCHPHLTVSNFSTDWNSGKALQGVIEFCRPGTFPHWMHLDTYNGESNCREGIEAAENLFGIPSVVSAEHFSSPDLDELSGMTYISYFMHEGEDGVRKMGEGQRSCGYEATLKFANSEILKVAPEARTTNFDVDWNDGFRASALIEALGGTGTIYGFPNIDRSNATYNCEVAMRASESLDIPRVIPPKDMADEEVDHLGPMAYVAWHRKLASMTPAPAPPPPQEPVPEPEPEPEPEPVVVVPVVPVARPASIAPPDVDVTVPPYWRTNATYTLMADTYRVGAGVITATIIHVSGEREEVDVRRSDDNKFDIPFHPIQKGPHLIHIYYDGQEVVGSPFTINVYNISLARVIRHLFGPVPVNDPYMFQVDVCEVGYDDIDLYVMHEGLRQQFDIRNNGNGIYDVRFFPKTIGVYTVQVFCGGEQIPESPFDIECAPRGGNVVARGDGLYNALCRRKATFEVDTTEFKGQTLEIKIYSPSGRMLRVEQRPQSGNKDVFEVRYFPDEEGTHQVEIFYSDGPIPGCPFHVNVKEQELRVQNLDNRAVKNRQSHFIIDASDFDDGTVEIDSALPVMKYEKCGDKMYDVTLLPHKAGQFDLKVSIDGYQVKGSPFIVDVTAQ